MTLTDHHINKESVLGYYVGRAFKAFNHKMHHKFESAGAEIQFDSWVKLFMFEQMGNRIQKDLAAFSGIHKATITRTIDSLEEKGFVERIPDEADRRQNRIAVTQPGREIISRYIHLIEEGEKEILEGIPSDDVEICRGVLTKVWNNCQRNCEKLGE